MNSTLLEQYGNLWEEIQRDEEMIKNKKAQLRKMESDLAKEMVSEGCTKLSVGGRPFWLKRAVHSRIPSRWREDVNNYLASHPETEGLVKPTVNASSFSSWVREQFDPDQLRGAEEIKAALPPELAGKIEVAEVFSIGTRTLV